MAYLDFPKKICKLNIMVKLKRIVTEFNAVLKAVVEVMDRTRELKSLD